MSTTPTPLPEEIIQLRLREEHERLARELGIEEVEREHHARPVEHRFTASQRPHTTVLYGGLTWKHERLIHGALEGLGYRPEALPCPDVAAFQLGHAKDALVLHHAERWRAELIADDEALTRWTAGHPGSDVQQLRSLIRSARKEAQAQEAALPGEAQRHGRAYRELFKLLRAALNEEEASDE